MTKINDSNSLEFQIPTQRTVNVNRTDIVIKSIIKTYLWTDIAILSDEKQKWKNLKRSPNIKT